MGKGICIPGNKRKPDRWMIDPIETVEGLRADVCRSCWENYFAAVPLEQEETREAGMRKAKEQNPNLSPLALAMRFGRATVQSVQCDCCQQQCIEKHLQLRSAWVEQNEFTLEAQICEICVTKQLSPLIQFEAVEAKQPTRSVELNISSTA